MPSFLDDLTVLALTHNEAPNIGRTLAQLRWATDILVIDSFSTDDTLQIASAFPNVRAVQRAFISFADQCNFGLTQIQRSWVLSLDADYVLSRDLRLELQGFQPAAELSGYMARFEYCVAGHPLRASLYPPRTVLYRRVSARYRNDGHGHRVDIDGRVGCLRGQIRHDDRKPLDRWLRDQLKYARLEAEKLVTRPPPAPLTQPDRIRTWIMIAPVLVFFYTLLGKRLFLDGRPGCYYILQRTCAEALLSLCLLERKCPARGPRYERRRAPAAQAGLGSEGAQ